MSKVEIIILIMICCAPLFSFFVVFKPKLKNLFKKKDKSKKIETKEEKPEEKPEPIVEQAKPKEKTIRDEMENSFSKTDFKDFASTKKEKISFPEMKFNKNNMSTYDLDEFDKPRQKTISEQINSLSPELKAMIIAGVLDKKDIDNM